ncbi:putative Ig domain-containing protein [Novosphingobium sp. PASSN1]|uniref:putative Ig domain-containing protein n=1 Tax=Novosphingobium sp. PASSN1 TaxID=2015561 RepID=UPI0025E0B1C8|nr:putative Ig domain-containing protein [Novosphingobium sp. PASSN1]
MAQTLYGDVGGVRNDYIVGNNGVDLIYGLDGVDELHGRGGDDQIFGGNGEDTLFGEDANDTLDGGGDNDQLDGGYGNDTLIGGSGDDLFIVNDDTDTINDLGNGNDDLSVGPGAIANATAIAAWAATAATINDGTVNITTAGFAIDLGLAGGGTGFAVTNTGAAVALTGSAQNDTLTAGLGADKLTGGAGDDYLVSSAHLAAAIYAGNEADYTLTKIGRNTWQVVDTNTDDGDDGTDTLVGIPTVKFADTTITLQLNQAPVLAASITDVSIEEDSALSFTVPSGAFSDPDGDVLTLSATLANGSPLPAWLSFDAATQTFTGTPPANFTGQIVLKVAASDGEYTATDTFTLTIDPVNDAPLITSGGGGSEASYTVLENSRTVGRIVASDVDPGASLTYSIVGGADAGKFQISSKGALSFITAPNFEKPTDVGANNVYDVIVRVSDGQVSDTQTLHVSVGNVINEILNGTVRNDIIQGSAGSDLISGFGGDDLISGGRGNDKIYGGLGDDRLGGGVGDDKLYGGEGNDSLSGGSGRDYFVFDVAPTADNADTINDFSHLQRDKVVLSIAIYDGFGATGLITADQFHAAAGATTAADAEDRLVYNTSSGALYYDVDGVGGEAAVQIATIVNYATAGLAYNDFAIVA